MVDPVSLCAAEQRELLGWEPAVCSLPLASRQLGLVCTYEGRDERNLNSFPWLGLLSYAWRCRGYLWSDFVLAVVEQCLLLCVSCLTLIVSNCTVGPRAKKRRLGKAIVPAASLATYSNELKQWCAPSACLLCCWNSKEELPAGSCCRKYSVRVRVNLWFLEIFVMSVTDFSSDCIFLVKC